ncbi:MAG: hypothetical protein AAGA18_14730 [Verrucomicrobiota bacterium]
MKISRIPLAVIPLIVLMLVAMILSPGYLEYLNIRRSSNLSSEEIRDSLIRVNIFIQALKNLYGTTEITVDDMSTVVKNINEFMKHNQKDMDLVSMQRMVYLMYLNEDDDGQFLRKKLHQDIANDCLTRIDKSDEVSQRI